jgi:hypothetical protein
MTRARKTTEPAPTPTPTPASAAAEQSSSLRRGVQTGEPEEPPRGPQVDVDTLVDRPDLGPGASTFVHAGDFVPYALRDNKRRPA